METVHNLHYLHFFSLDKIGFHKKDWAAARQNVCPAKTQISLDIRREAPIYSVLLEM